MIEFQGKTYGFLLTAEAACALGDMCPDRDLDKLDEALTGSDTAETVQRQIHFAKILNDGYADYAEMMGRSADRLNEEDIPRLPFPVFMQIKNAAFEAYIKGLRGEIDAEILDPKKQETRADG